MCNQFGIKPAIDLSASLKFFDQMSTTKPNQPPAPTLDLKATPTTKLEYTIVFEYEVKGNEGFVARVNELIGAGWLPLGGPASHGSGRWIIQAMTRTVNK